VSNDNFTTCIALGAPAMSAGDSLATITPAPGLTFGSTFKIKVTTAAQNALGTPLGADVVQPAGFTTQTDLAPVEGSVVISQVYGGGGNTGALYTHDFVELHNRGTTSVSLSGMAIQLISATGTGAWTAQALTGSIPPGGYYLIQEAIGSGGTQALPTPDQTFAFAMGANGIKVALTSDTTPLSGQCPAGATVLDLVGGGNANCFEGAAAATGMSNTASIVRGQLGFLDTNQNGTDFSAITPPTPRNTASTTQKFVLNESNLAAEADYCNIQFPLTTSAQTGMATEAIYCQVYEAGETEPPGAPANFTMEVGYGPIGSNPQDQAGWTWTPAAHNAGFVDPNNDEFFTTLTAPAPGSYRYACRVVRNNAYTYCDVGGAGSNAGLSFNTTHQGELTVTP
jgi:hypothetical protein